VRHAEAHLEDLDQDPAANVAEWRRTVGTKVHLRVEQYARAIGGLKKIDHLQFEQLLVDALFGCAVMHLDAPRRKRFSEIRKVLLRVEKEAAASETHLERLRDALAELEPGHRERLDGRLDLLSKIACLIESRPPSFHALSSVSRMARFDADELFGKKDKGGAPKKMVAFSMLVRGLIRAFQRATGKPAKVTWSEIREKYEGKFLSLVEAVLPLALEAACQQKQPMPHPDTAHGRGKYIQRMTNSKRDDTATGISKT
jgi:hypothetical protein